VYSIVSYIEKNKIIKLILFLERIKTYTKPPKMSGDTETYSMVKDVYQEYSTSIMISIGINILYYVYSTHNYIKQVAKYERELNKKLVAVYDILDSINEMKEEMKEHLEDIEARVAFNRNRNNVSLNSESISKEDLMKKDLAHSKIVYSRINNFDIYKFNLSYKGVLKILYGMIPKETILEHTKFNIKKFKFNDNGYKWDEDLVLSIQGKDAKNTLAEILMFTEIQKFNMYIMIELENEEIIEYYQTY